MAVPKTPCPACDATTRTADRRAACPRCRPLAAPAKRRAPAPARATPLLRVESLEDRVVPAMYAFDMANNTLAITLGTNESLTYSGGSFTVSGTGVTNFLTTGTLLPGNNTTTITPTAANIAGGLLITNANASTVASVNDVIFAAGALTSARIGVSLTDANAGTDVDSIQLNGATLTGTGGMATVALVVQNGAIASTGGTDISAAANILLSAGAGVGGVNGVIDVAGATTLAASGGTNGVFVSSGAAATVGVVTPGAILGTTFDPLTGVTAAVGTIALTVGGENALTVSAPVANAGPASNGDVLLRAGGSVTVGAAVSSTAGNVTIVADTNDTAAGDVTVTAAGSVASTGGGTITLGDSDPATTGGGAQAVVLSGPVTASGGPVGSTNDGIVIRAENDINLGAAVTVSGSTRGVFIDANSDAVSDTGIVNVTAGLTTAGGRITLVGEDVDLTAAVTTGSPLAGVITFNPRGTSAPVVLGADPANAQEFGITAADFNRLTANVVVVGSATRTGNVQIGETAANGGAPIVIDPARVPVLQIVTLGGVTDGTPTDTAGVGTGVADLTVQNLSIRAGTVGALAANGGLDTAVTNLAVSASGLVVVSNLGSLTLGTVVGDVVGLPPGISALAGVAGGGLVAVAANRGSLTVAPAATATAAAGPNQPLYLSAGNDLIVNGDVTTVGNTAAIANLFVDTQVSDFTAANLASGTSFTADPDPTGGTFGFGPSGRINSPTGNVATITGGDAADSFIVRPQIPALAGATTPGGAALSIRGGGPTAAPGDVLSVDTLGANGTTQAGTTPNGTFSFVNRQPITYTAMEAVNSGAGFPTVTLVATDAAASEPLAGQPVDAGVFTVTRAGGDATQPLVVNLTLGIEATAATLSATGDYTLSVVGATLTGTGPFTLTFGPNQTTATITVTALADAVTETDETVTIGVAPGGYNIGTNTAQVVTITDAARVPVNVSVTTTDGTAVEGSTTDTGLLTFMRTGSTADPLTINLALATTPGSATFGTTNADFTLAAGAGATLAGSGPTFTLTFPAGANTATIVVTALADSIIDTNESVTLSITPATPGVVYTPVGPPGVVTIVETPPAPPTVPPPAPPPAPPTSPPPPAATPAPSATGVLFSGGSAVVARASGGPITFVAPPNATIQAAEVVDDFNGNGTRDFGVLLTLQGIGPVLLLVEAADAQPYAAIGDLNGDGIGGDVVVQLPAIDGTPNAVFFFDARTGRVTRLR